MRPPNFKLDWFIPEQVIGLTHFHAAVTQDDIMGVMQKGQELTDNAKQEFHIIIDNRVVNMPAPMSLSQMVQMVPYATHPLLRWIIVVKPESLSLDAASLPVEENGGKHLKNVASLPEAIEFLMKMAPEVEWQRADANFFPNADDLLP